MTEEELMKAAAENILYNHRTSDRTLSGKALAGFGQICFCQGAQWRINTVWHDNTEKPNREGEIIIRFTYLDNVITGVINYKHGQIYLTYKGFRWIDWDSVIHWAYIEDLLPKTE